MGAILAAVLVVDPASGSIAANRRTAKAAEGVVQSTVSGSGNLEPASQLDLGFKTAGTVQRVYVKQGASTGTSGGGGGGEGPVLFGEWTCESWQPMTMKRGVRCTR